MTNQEKILFVADLLFAILSICFFLPKFRKTLWLRLAWIAFAFGANAIAFYRDKNITWLFYHGHYYRPFLTFGALATLFSWSSLYSLDKRFSRFVPKHQRLLWGIVIVILLLIPVTFCWIMGYF